MSDTEFLLHAPHGSNKKRKRVGRGSSSGLGTTSGRGNKGQQSRSGGKVYVGFEGGQMPLYRRVAQRGFSNYRFKKTYVVFNLDDLDAKFSDGETVDKNSLIAKGLLKRARSKAHQFVKILGDGDLGGKKLSVAVDKVSKSAKEKIEKAGGSVVVDEE